MSEAKKRVADEGGLKGKEWLCTYEVMAFCSMSEGSLKTAMKERGFPQPVKQGIRKNLYSRQEIDSWITKFF